MARKKARKRQLWRPPAGGLEPELATFYRALAARGTRKDDGHGHSAYVLSERPSPTGPKGRFVQSLMRQGVLVRDKKRWARSKTPKWVLRVVAAAEGVGRRQSPQQAAGRGEGKRSAEDSTPFGKAMNAVRMAIAQETEAVGRLERAIAQAEEGLSKHRQEFEQRRIRLAAMEEIRDRAIRAGVPGG